MIKRTHFKTKFTSIDISCYVEDGDEIFTIAVEPYLI